MHNVHSIGSSSSGPRSYRRVHEHIANLTSRSTHKWRVSSMVVVEDDRRNWNVSVSAEPPRNVGVAPSRSRKLRAGARGTGRSASSAEPRSTLRTVELANSTPG